MLDGARIFHVNVNCSDLAASRAFYVERVRADRGRAHDARRRAVGHRVRARPRAVGRVDPRRRRRLRRRRGRPPRVAGPAPDGPGARSGRARASPASGSRSRPTSAPARVADPDGVVGRPRGRVRRRASSPSRSAAPTATARSRSTARSASRRAAGSGAGPTRSSSPRRAAARSASCSRPAATRDRGAARPANTRRDLAHRAPRRRPRRRGGAAARRRHRAAVGPAGDGDGPGRPRPAVRLLPWSRPRGHRAHRVTHHRPEET